MLLYAIIDFPIMLKWYCNLKWLTLNKGVLKINNEKTNKPMGIQKLNKTKTLRRSSKSAKNCARKIDSSTRCKTNAIQSLEQKVQDLFGVLSSCRSQRFAEKGLGKKKDKFVKAQFLSTEKH